MCASFVRIEPAGVEDTEENGLMIGGALMFVRLSHDEILYEGERMLLV